MRKSWGLRRAIRFHNQSSELGPEPKFRFKDQVNSLAESNSSIRKPVKDECFHSREKKGCTSLSISFDSKMHSPDLGQKTESMCKNGVDLIVNLCSGTGKSVTDECSYIKDRKGSIFLSNSSVESISKGHSLDLGQENEIRCKETVDPMVNSCSGVRKLVTDESSCISEKKGGTFFSNAMVPSDSKDRGFHLGEETEIGCKHNIGSIAKLYSGIGKLVIAKCSYIWESKGDTFEANCSLQDVLKLGIGLLPETLRRFWRASVLKPEDFLEILIGFVPDGVDLRQSRFLWNLFRWAAWSKRGFQHLPRSKDTMVTMLASAQMFEEAETLLLSLDHRSVLSDADAMFSQIIQGYSEAGRLNKSMALYECARDKGSIPTASCYKALLHLLIRKGKDQLVLRVYLDMLEVGLGLHSEEHVLDFVVAALVKNERFIEAIAIIRQLKALGVDMSRRTLTAVAEEFCKKKDFGDMMNFLEEWRHIPEQRVCNLLISSLCMNLGTEEAWLFFQKLEALGFTPDAITFGIFICHSCRERRLRDAFVYLSECLSRYIEPNVCVYNILISGVFKEGLYRHARYVFDDMVERKVIPDLSTYKIILAGCCKYRKFDEIEQVFSDMTANGVTELPSGNCVLSKALSFLGLDHLGVKVKRDNGTGLPKSEFFDSVGNSLYLETDSDKFETSLVEILDSVMFPDISSKIISECQRGNVGSAIQLKDEAFQWGHNMSVATYSELLKALCASPENITDAGGLIKEMPDMCDQLDSGILNLLVQTLSKNGMSACARSVLDSLLKRGLPVQKESYSNLMKGFCRDKDIVGFWECWKLATTGGWSPGGNEIMSLVSCLCKWGVIKDAVQLLDALVDCYPDLFFSAYSSLLKHLCKTGYTNVGCAMVETFLEKGLVTGCSLVWNLVEGFLKEQKTAETFGIYEIWLGRSKVPNAAAYRLILPSLARSDVERAIGLLESIQNIELSDVSVYSTVVKELIQTTNIKQATLLFDEMVVAKTLDGTFLNALLQAYCCLKNWRKIHEVLSIMLRMNAALSVSSYRCLVRQMCNQNQFYNALGLKELAQESNKSRELVLYNILIFYLLQRGNNLLVDDLLKAMQDKDITLDKTSYDFLVYGFHKCGNINRSVDALNACIARGIVPSSRSLRTVLAHHCSVGSLEKSLELFRLIESKCWKHGSVIENCLVPSLLSSGRYAEAKLCLDTASKRVITRSNANYDLLIKKFCLAGDTRTAINLLNTMLKKGNLPSEVGYSSIVQSLSISREFDQAFDFLAEMLFMNLKPTDMSCNALISGLCAAGRTDDARRILEMMTKFGSVPTYYMYNLVIDKYYASNSLQKAAALLHDMQQVGYKPNFETHWSVISNLSTPVKKTEGDGKPILSNLVSWSGRPVKNHKVQSFSALRYNR